MVAITKRIGLRIKELRLAQNVSQEEFANGIGMARTYFTEVEAGKRNVSINNIEKIARGLGISLQDFFHSVYFE